jgi:hypothetical protein
MVNAQRIQRGLPLSFAQLHDVSRVEVIGPGGEVLLRGTFVTKQESASDMDREATLSAVTGAAKGLAEIEIERTNNVTTKDEIEVAVEGLPASAAHKLMVDGQEATTFSTTSRGKAELKLSRTFPKR